MAYTPNNNPYIPGDPYSYDLKWLVSQIKRLDGIMSGLDERIRLAVIAALDQHDPVYYDTAADLISSDQRAPSIAYIEGFYNAGDGGANLYYITDDYNDVLAADFYLTMSGPNKWAIPIILTPWVTPEMFGAAGDGLTDDTAAVMTAFNYPVIYAFRSYLVNRMQFSGNFVHTLYGAGTGKMILAVTNANIIQIDATSGSFTVDGMEFDGNHFRMVAPGGGLVQANGVDLTMRNCYLHDYDGSNASNAISAGGQHYHLIDNCRIVNCASGPYLLGKIKNVVRNCYIENCLAGVQLSSTKHALVDGNTFYQCQNDVTGMTTYTAEIKDITIVNNKFIETTGYGEYTGSITFYVNKVSTDTIVGLTVANNTFTDINCAAVALGQIAIPTGQTDTFKDANIHDNIINITANTGDAVVGAFVVMSSSDVRINNNRIVASGTKGLRGVYFRGKRFTGELRFNTFAGNFRDFVYNSGTATDLDIQLDLEHNTFDNAIDWLLTIGTSTILTDSYVRVLNAPGEITYNAADYITSTFYNHVHVNYSPGGTYTRYLISANTKGAGMILHMGNSDHFYYYDHASSTYRELTTQSV